MKYVVLNILLLIISIIAVEFGQLITGMVALLAMIPVALIAHFRGIKIQRN